ncbi:hypothetical protein, partial [Bradyrhizobium sp. ORS 375]|uniref:hypothetical protein n=1 Tax=Bradyrhizobium sp. (strain ORS 375) TaxID=566679 RepID=UPI001AEC4DCA
MSMAPTPNSAVIARLDRAIQYAAAIVSPTTAAAYWMPAFAGMTRWCGSGALHLSPRAGARRASLAL